MSFADDVRRSYIPAEKQQRDPERYRKMAEHLVNLAKENLMSLSRSGNVTKLYTGLGIIPKKVFQTGFSVTIEKSFDTDL